MNRGSRQSGADLLRQSGIAQLQKHSNGLPYVPSTPSTRGSSYSGSSEDFEYDDDGRQPQRSSRSDKSRRKMIPSTRQSNDRGRSVSPTKGVTSRISKAHRHGDDFDGVENYNTSNNTRSSLTDRSRVGVGGGGGGGRRHEEEATAVEYHQPPRLSNHSSGSHSKMGSTTSQSTSSTSSSQQHLIQPHLISSSSCSISTFGSHSTNSNHNKPQQQSHPVSVRNEHIYDYHDDEDDASIAVDEDDGEEDTIHTRPMIRYKTNAKRSIQTEINEDDESPFLNESFDTIDFGSTTGVAPPSTTLQQFDAVVPPASKQHLLVRQQQQQPQQRQPLLLKHQQQQQQHHQQLLQRSHHDYQDEHEFYDDNDDDDRECYDDEALLYENSDDNLGQPLYDDMNNEYYYDDNYQNDEAFNECEVIMVENERMHRAVRRGSALASSSDSSGGRYQTGNTTTAARGTVVVENRGIYATTNTDQRGGGQYISNRHENRPSYTRTEQHQQQQQQQLQPMVGRRQQISRSMSSKRHLIAASARGVVATTKSTMSNNLVAHNDGEIQRTSLKNRGSIDSDNNMQQQPRHRVTRASSYGENERPLSSHNHQQQQQPPSRRGSVTKVVNHSTRMPPHESPPRSRNSNPTRVSRSNHGNNGETVSDMPLQPTIQQPPQRQRGGVARNSSRINTSVEEDVHGRPDHRQRHSVGKAASNGAIIPQHRNIIRRNSVNKAASQNGYFETSEGLQPSPLPQLHHGARGGNRHQELDPVTGSDNLLPPTRQNRSAQPSLSRRRSLEYAPSSSIQNHNDIDCRYPIKEQRRRQPSRDNDQYEYDYDDDDDYMPVLAMTSNIPSKNQRRMSAGYLPQTQRASPTQQALATRSAPQRSKSIDLSVNEYDHVDQMNDQQHEVSFSDLAIRRY